MRKVIWNCFSPMSISPAAANGCCFIRELDGLELDKDLLAFKARLEDRFGKVPSEGLKLCVSYLCADWLNGWGGKRESILEKPDE